MNAAAREPGTRRRAAERRPRPSLRATREAVVPAVLVLLALVGAGLTAVSAGSGASAPAGTVTGALVDRTTFACPDVPATRGTTTSVGIALAPAPSGVQPADGGSVTQGPVTSEGRRVDVRRGSAVPVRPTGGPAVVATGGAAAGLFGYRTDNRPYEVTATVAVQDVRKPNVVELSDMKARFATDEK